MPIHCFFGVSVSPLFIVFLTDRILGWFFIVLKSGIDAADGELARQKNTFLYWKTLIACLISYSIFCLTICYVSKQHFG
jgi:phosphatidylglycerophosphate synthase